MMTRTTATLLLLQIAYSFAAISATAQQAEPVTPDNASDLVKRVYDLSQNASSEEQYSEIIGLCERLVAAEISQKKIDYAKRLGAWAYNRRGEAFAEQAAALVEKGSAPAAEAADKKALVDFDRSIKLDPTKWKAYHNRGVSNALAGEFESALADFTKAVELNPDYGNTWFNRGEIYFEQGEFAKAIADYNQAIELDQTDAGAVSRRGRALARLGRHREAVQDFSHVIRLAPQDADSYTDRAESFADLGQWQAAANDFRMAIRLNSDSGRTYRGAAWLMATSPDESFRNNELAVQAARKAVELDGKASDTLDVLAAALANAGQFEEAIIHARDAAEKASADDRAEIQARLKLYEAGKPYRQE